MANNKFNFFTLTIMICFFIQKNSEAAEAKAKEEPKKIEGSFDLGANFVNGNSKEESIQANLDFNYLIDKKTTNILKARADNQEANKVRTQERYFVNNQTKQNISEHNFKFVELEYVNDRFSGFNYRISETVGLGTRIIDNKKFKLDIDASTGLRQSKLTTGEKNNNFLVRGGANFKININENLTFEEDFDVSSDQDAVVIRSDANLRITVSKKLYLKFGVLVQRISNVPSDTKNSDVVTALKLGYQFSSN